MAHFILEYSSNLAPTEIDIRALLQEIVTAAIDTGVFPAAGCRARAHRCEDYFVGNGDPQFCFLHLQVRMGAGRSPEEKDRALAALKEVLVAHTQALAATRGTAVSIELVDLPEYKANINNLREYIAPQEE